MIRRILLVLPILLLLTGICTAGDETIYRITLLGNVKVEEGVIRGAIKSREGGPFSAERVREDLRAIFGLGYFTDVQVDIKSAPEGKEVIFIVVEKPSVKEFLITGNDKVKLSDIKEKVVLQPRSILNLDKVKESAEQIRKLYFSKGYYGVNVDPKIDYLETNEVVVTFRITEGSKGYVKNILLKGNKKIKSSDLKKIMTTKEKTLLSFITKTGVLDEDALKNDTQLLSAYYIDHGYLDVKVSEPKIDFGDPKKIKIEIDVTEGPQYELGNIDFKGDVLTTKEALFKIIKIKRHDIYSNSAIRRDITALTEKFANQGYAYAEVTPSTKVDSKNLLVDLTFEVEKKKRVSFERIQITGNTKSRDKVIRRELQVAEGELYNAAQLSKSRDRLRRTGFFKEVEFTTTRGSSDDKINLDLKVEEAPTGAVTFGVGYSSLEKIVGSASISDRNLFGMGYFGSLKFSLGPYTNNLRFSFTDPYFLGYLYAAGIDLYHERVAVFSSYSYKVTGGDLRLGKEFFENVRLDATYKLETIDVFDVSRTAAQVIKDQEGKRTTSAISLVPSMDTRNDFFSPSRGARHSLFVEKAGGVLGGDNSFVKVVGDTSWFFPLPMNMVLNLRGKVGFIQPSSGTDVPIYEKFYVGGSGTVRGFEYGTAGPVDQNGEPVGANRMAIYSTELVFPLAKEIGLRGAVFFDVGKGWGLDKKFILIKDHPATPENERKIFQISDPSLKLGTGFGIRWFSPFGPINVDLGFNLKPENREKGHVIDFNAGSTF